MVPQLALDVADELVENVNGDVALDGCANKTAHELLTIEGLLGPIMLTDDKRKLLAALVRGEPKAAGDAFTAGA